MHRKTLFPTIVALVLISIIAYGFILYGKGYRLNLSGEGNKILAGTGLLVLTSTPNGAKAYIDENLTTATDDTINLPPGEYDVKIEKDGYYPWKKHVTLKNEAVTKTDAVLFPIAPKLETVSLLGANDPLLDSTGSLVAYKVSSSSAENNGIYVLNLGNRLLPFGTTARQIASDSFDEFTSSKLEFSPDGAEILATINNLEQTVYLLRTDSTNPTPQNVTATLDEVHERWEQIQLQKNIKFIATLPSAPRAFILNNFYKPVMAPEGDKILYIASHSATMPLFKNPPLPSTNSTPETREIKEGSVYVYQLKEDKNYLLFEAQPGAQIPDFKWHPSSSHVVFELNKKIVAMEYDGGNRTTLYAGPFQSGFLTTWPDGSGLVILTNFNDESVPPNLYKVGLR